jgi:predicted transcriptional regulator
MNFQVEIAKYLGISSSTVSKILLEDRSESGNS